MSRKKSQLEKSLELVIWGALALFLVFVGICIQYPIIGFSVLFMAIIIGLLIYRNRIYRNRERRQVVKQWQRDVLEFYEKTGDPELRDILLRSGVSKQLIEEIDNRHLARIRKLDQLTAMSPKEFEQFVAKLFEKMGYSVAVTKASADEGVDLFLEKSGRRAIVQCKKYKGSVGQSTVRDFYGAMIHNRADQGFIVTTGTFSLPAQTWAMGKQIHLVDGAELMDWIESLLASAGEIGP